MMKPVLTPTQVRDMESRSGESDIQMVQRAAACLWTHIRQFAPRRVRFLCGPGNNGADGYAAAILAQNEGVETDVWAVYPPRSEACLHYANLARPDHFSGAPDVWVDAVFGSGFRPGENPVIAHLRQQILTEGGTVIAVDAPSGLDTQTGLAADWAIPAQLTVTMGFWKPGLLFGDGPDLCGEICLAELGFPVPPDVPQLMEPRDAASCYPCRRHNAYKNTYGHLLILAGSEGMAGAAAMCARAAVRGGAGLTTIVCPRCAIPVLQVLCPEAMCRPLEDIADWPALLQGKTAVAAGPGYTGPSEPLQAILTSGLPAVLDAGALSLLARHPALMSLLKPCHIITPHPGEARRLLPQLPEDPIAAASALHALGCTAIYKGTASVIAGDSIRISRSGCPGMAKGGSGDALTGLVGALLCQGYDPFEAACAADELHGLAGSMAQRSHGDISMTAMDLIDHIHQAIDFIRRSPV